MKRYFKLLALVLASVMVIVSLAGCTKKEKNDIYIYFTGDAHCADDENLGYAGVKSLIKHTKENLSEYVTLVDTGDAIWGDFLGNNSQGEYIIDLMNDVGYDYAVLGNHEFDYGMEQLSKLMEMSSATYLGCNVSYTGKGVNALAKLVPFAIEAYGDTKVGFVGVTTPESITDSSPKNFMENGEYVYDFGNSTKENFYALVQTQVDACREQGADYIVLLTHLGDGEEYAEFSSDSLIGSTSGVNAVLDGHAHSTISNRVVKNKNGEDVVLASTGTGLENIGRLIITPAGGVYTSLVSGDLNRDADIDSKIENENERYDAIMREVVGKSDFELPTHNEAGERIVRNQETALGNFCADAYRASTGADIAVINGGGLRAALPKGDITFGDILALHPYGNNICVVYAKGSEIADALEFSVSLLELDEDGNPVGENGGFLQVSGLKFTVDTSIESTVAVDQHDMFVSVEGERRVSDILVETDGEYVPLDMEKTYTLASFNFLLQDCGDGYSMFADNDFAVTLGGFDYETVIEYIQSFEDKNLPAEYSALQNRINIK